ncbi:exodeoxyribonuclease I [Buchnera aphidicola (Aphis craccivora)]|uniref:Exodeoxyribonuclease I n=2 Tax=cellular organisms TaxID=131567 RepID=A0A6G0W4R3_APHCR|nr:exodeoxyribonuclease I [Buchnera aphidicola]KAF0720545.1 Exodeoxyribonuclease I [Aphis craccivora]QCI16778.1 exodeoxyribonuclease I [Buchnera aphidicola (Aphis craccivora)]QLL40910.1 exodeoxyribonuclease I [Buchnera aphidicola (Aphis craccivore)]WAI17751.1 MAG: exodeoxyribonuclease I [Buchnera aphidicola (Aphis craccivora)]
MNKHKKILYQKNLFTLLFYDYETFGTHTSLDKPAQFASIRTDENLTIIEEPKCFYCFPSDDYLPEPYSILTTKITPQYTFKHGTNEYEFSRKIYNILIKPNTCIVGYNNIAFDDEITRNIFYRNFLDPYEWSWKNNNSRWDLLNIMRVCYLLRPHGIKWPKNNLGFPIFKLSELTQENNILHYNAHDAISDVYATIELAKLIRKKQPKLFNFFFKYRKKNELYKLININSFQPILYISSYFTVIRNNMSFILPLFWDENNSNLLIAIDLFKDIKKLIEFFKKNHYQNVNSKNLFDLGIVLIYFNRCPILVPIQFIRTEDAERLKLKDFYIDEKINLIKLNYFIINHIKFFLSKINIFQEISNVDLKIYHGFFNLQDKQLIKKISNTNPIHLKNITLGFKDIRLKELFFRYKARNFIFILNTNEKKIWFDHCFKVFNRLVLKEYVNKIENLLEKFSYDIEKVNLLNKLLKYIFEKYKTLFYQKINLN